MWPLGEGGGGRARLLGRWPDHTPSYPELGPGIQRLPLETPEVPLDVAPLHNQVPKVGHHSEETDREGEERGHMESLGLLGEVAGQNQEWDILCVEN